jgi:hypothetical protein
MPTVGYTTQSPIPEMAHYEMADNARFELMGKYTFLFNNILLQHAANRS